MASEKPEYSVDFLVKYLGCRNANGLWGIKHTKAPVHEMVTVAKNMKPGDNLPYVVMTITEEGVRVTSEPKDRKNVSEMFHAIDTISYGVQDLVYTRVFSMIVVKELGDMKGHHPFECHAFACDSRKTAKLITKSLASAFKKYSETVKSVDNKRKKTSDVFGIDLRTPEERAAGLQCLQGTDSEA